MRYFLTILTLATLLAAAPQSEIDALINDVVHAPEAQRYEKMNAFKRKMRELNEQQRREALEALQERMHVTGGGDTPAPQTGTEAGTNAQQLQQRQLRLQQQQQQQQQMQQLQQNQLRPQQKAK